MKKTQYLILAFILLVSSGIILAQDKTYNITTSHIEIKGNQQSCVHVEIDPGKKLSKDAWEDFLKDKYEVKMKGKYEMQAKEVVFTRLSAGQINFHTIISGDENFSHIDLLVAFDKKTFAKPETNPVEFENMKDLLDEFLSYFLQKYYVSEIKTHAKAYKKLKKNFRNA